MQQTKISGAAVGCGFALAVLSLFIFAAIGFKVWQSKDQANILLYGPAIFLIALIIGTMIASRYFPAKPDDPK
ncbi:MAG TPA: hypothetical protein VEJ63_00240 [Planctomycetota bacterium]|nr:hypothetical protein [Planctomycetota bacterium]